MRNYQLLFLPFILIACSVGGDSHYRDNSALERPPNVVVDKNAGDTTSSEEQVVEPKKRHGKGLKSDVNKVENSEVKLRIKRPYDESWLLLGQALQLRELKIPDQDRSKGVYYVAFDGSGFLSQATSFFANDDHKAPTYLVKLIDEGEETEVSVVLANPEEQSNKSASKGETNSDDSSANLTEVLFDTLHDEVKEE